MATSIHRRIPTGGMRLTGVSVCIGFVLLITGFNAFADVKSYTIAIDSESSIPAGTAVTFGLVFPATDIAWTDTLTAELEAGGSPMSMNVQLDKKSSYCATRSASGSLIREFSEHDSCALNDRFLRTGIATVVMPVSIAPNQRATLKLTQADDNGNVGGEIQLPSDLRARIELDTSGGVYGAVLDVESIRSLGFGIPPWGSSSTVVSEWLNGPHAREWSVLAPLRRLSDDAEHPTLTARFGIRHYPDSDNTRIEVVVENTKTFSEQMGSHDYGVRVFVNGSIRYEDSQLVHLPHSRWRTTHWTKPYPKLHVIHDPLDLLASQAVPNYDPSLIYKTSAKLTNITLRALGDHTSSEVNGILRFPAKREYCYESKGSQVGVNCGAEGAFKLALNTYGPMGIGPLIKSMPSTGGRSEIGPLPQWIAGYILLQNRTFYDATMAIAGTSGSWPMHYRDENTQLPISIENHPQLENVAKTLNGSNNIKTCSFSANCLTPYRPDDSHQPSLTFVPYLVTGDIYYLEEAQFWATYNNVSSPARFRGNELGLYESSSQVRGAAWKLRNLAQAAFATPDNHKLKQHYGKILDNNIKEYGRIYLDNPSNSPSYGAVIPSGYPAISPWQDDYLTWAVGYTVDLGYESALPFARWKGRFSVQRLGAGTPVSNEYCYVFAAPYRLLAAPDSRIPLSESQSLAKFSITRGISSVPQDFVMFRDIGTIFTMSNEATNGGISVPTGAAFDTQEACGTLSQFEEQGLSIGRINGNSGFTDGYGSQLGIALSAAVNANTPEAIDAYAIYANRADIPEFANSPTWAIVPRNASQLATIESALPALPTVTGGECTVAL